MAPLEVIACARPSGVGSGISTVAATPVSEAAWATAAPWFPVEAATTPRARSSSERCCRRCMAPRILKDPVGSADSIFSSSPPLGSRPRASRKGEASKWRRRPAAAWTLS